jgi:hypothetical protein
VPSSPSPIETEEDAAIIVLSHCATNPPFLRPSRCGSAIAKQAPADIFLRTPLPVVDHSHTALGEPDRPDLIHAASVSWTGKILTAVPVTGLMTGLQALRQLNTMTNLPCPRRETYRPRSHPGRTLHHEENEHYDVTVSVAGLTSAPFLPTQRALIE